MNKEELKQLREMLERFKTWTDETDAETMAAMKATGDPFTGKIYDEHSKNKAMLTSVLGWVRVKELGLGA